MSGKLSGNHPMNLGCHSLADVQFGPRVRDK